MLLAAVPAIAQEGVTVTVDVGINGYVDPASPGSARIEVTSPILLTGVLEVAVGGFQTSLDLEVPAGGQKVFDVNFPAPGSAGTVFVRIFDEDGTQVLRQTAPLSAPTDALVVGVLDDPAIERTLAAVRSRPLAHPIEAVGINASHVDPRLTALPYVVASAADVDRLDDEQRADLIGWIEAGGRLITTTPAVASLQLGGENPTPFGAASVLGVGTGELIVVGDLSGLTAEAWSELLRDVPRPVSAFNQFGQADPSFSLIEASVSGSSTAVPQLPWLLLGLLAYVVAVGPVNMIVLRRLDKTHLTWLTVPVMSLLAVGLFWLGSPRSAESATLRHASVVVYDQLRPTAASGVVLAAGAEGTYRLGFPLGWSGFPVNAGFQAAQPVGTTVTSAGSEITYDLDSLGTATAMAYWTPDRAPLSVVVDREGDGLGVTITNESEWDFWTWGLVSGTSASAGDRRLTPGSSGSVVLEAGFVGDPFQPPMIDAFFRNGGFVDGMDDPWTRLWPLAQAAGQLAPEVYTDGPFVYGYTDDMPLALTVDGSTNAATGPALVIVPLTQNLTVDAGSASGRLLGVDGADWIEGGGFEQFIGGAEAVYLSYRVPVGASPIDIVDNFSGGMNRTYAFYDWGAAEFVEVAGSNNLDLANYRSPTGELVMAIYPDDFGEVVPRAVTLVWR